jgi:general secretion pathway protein K
VKANNDRGFALLVVLWSLVLIGLLTTQILASGRTAMALASNLRNAAEARARADGAINLAIFHLLQSGANNWPADGSTHLLGTGAVTLTVRIDSLAGKINPNLASTALLAGLFQATGAAPAAAKQMAAGIIGWRSPAATKAETQALLAAYKRANLPYGPPGRPFGDISDLADVIGMKPALLANALPYMSLYQSGDPDPAQAGAVVRRALALSGQTGAGGYEGNFPVVSITAETTGPGGLAVFRTAIVSIAGANATTPFQLLALTDGAGP